MGDFSAVAPGTRILALIYIYNIIFKNLNFNITTWASKMNICIH